MEDLLLSLDQINFDLHSSLIFIQRECCKHYTKENCTAEITLQKLLEMLLPSQCVNKGFSALKPGLFFLENIYFKTAQEFLSAVI